MVAAKLFTVEIQTAKASNVQNVHLNANTMKIVSQFKIQNAAVNTLVFATRISVVTWEMLIAPTDMYDKCSMNTNVAQ